MITAIFAVDFSLLTIDFVTYHISINWFNVFELLTFFRVRLIPSYSFQIHSSMRWNASAIRCNRSCSINNNSFTYSGMHGIENKSVHWTALSTHKQRHTLCVGTKSVQKKIDNNKLIHRRKTTKQQRTRNERKKRKQIYKNVYRLHVRFITHCKRCTCIMWAYM